MLWANLCNFGQIMGKFSSHISKEDTSIRLFLDTRREKKSGKFPAKVRVYSKVSGTRTDFPIGHDFSQTEFDAIWNTNSPKGVHKDWNYRLKQIELEAMDLVDSMPLFDPEAFKARFYGVSKNRLGLNSLYEEVILECKHERRLNTAITYELSLKSFYAFHGGKSEILLTSITPKWLRKYEQYMLDQGKSLTTVSIYTRTLRAIYNRAVSENLISKEYYPFGRRKFEVPAPKAKKRALSLEQIKAFYNCECQSEYQQLAKDYWFLSYYCNGMNFTDMVQLTEANIDNGCIAWYRQKTRNTNKSQDIIRAVITPEVEQLLNRIKATKSIRSMYLLPVLEDFDSAEVRLRKTQNLTRFVNQHLKSLCKAIDFPITLTTYHARHTFVTIAVNAGVSVAHVSRALGHSSIETTKSYIGSLELKDEHALAAIISAAVTNEEVA